MQNNESLDVFLRLLAELHNKLKQKTENLLLAISNEDKNVKILSNKEMYNSANDLLRSLAERDRPNWLKTLADAGRIYNQNHKSTGATNNLQKTLISVYSNLNSHQWNFDKTSTIEAYDFDSIFEHFRKESKLPELYDLLIDSLQKIIDSEEIDSIRLTNSINKLIATLKKNKNGSYFSTRSAWDFTVSLLKNYVLEELQKIPVLGSLVKALVKTVTEIDTEMVSVHGTVNFFV